MTWLFLAVLGLFPYPAFAIQGLALQPEAPPTVLNFTPQLLETVLINQAEGNIAKSLSILSGILNQPRTEAPFINAEWQGALNLLAGILSCQNKEYAPALSFLKQAEEKIPALKDYILLYQARTLNAQGKYGETLALLSPSTTGERLVNDELFWEKTKSLMGLSRWNEVNSFLDKRKKQKNADAEEQISIVYYRGLIFFNQSNREAATLQWKTLFTNEPDNLYEEEILNHLKLNKKNLGQLLTHQELILRGQNLIAKGLALEAIPIYHALESSGMDMKSKIARATFKARKYAEAAILLQNLWDHLGAGQNRAEILTMLATSYGRSDQFEKAIEYQKKRLRLGNAAAKEITDKIAFLYFDAGQYEKAKLAYARLIGQSKNNDRTNALWKHFWCCYFLKNFDEARNDLETLLKEEKNRDEKRKYFYWMARIFEKQNNTKSAKILYQQLVYDSSMDYYGSLSLQQLDKEVLKSAWTIKPPPPAPFLPPLLELRRTSEGSGDGERVAAVDQTIKRAIFLSHIGLDRFAFDEAKHSLYAPDFQSTWALSFPSAYSLWVNHFSKQNNADPHLVFSIMRQESAFNPQALSDAGALGLMQLIPQTAKEIAKNLGQNNFHPSNLKEPETNIRYGSRYLKDLMNQFHYHLVYIIAAYNAGPDAVSRWKRWGNKLKEDELIELIPYQETNQYVKRVLTNYWIYQK